ncbi:DUF1365 domain-containing protein [Amylibacter sp. IMCC11727]|uniref:DUF1365 domain-containing protein n=1 Tax=Amylibacter sp. IMCC11727 TaxID=3039851 RepID=UPI00244E43B0|nr:DUF1365 domain-containing protein [Amylibacter sp. IMCC11727]WGI22608.1 DUF1365 domain-containing protein [Amylibacter sp. IMCC11727]
MGVTPEHICGHTYHGRHGAIKNAFRYRVDYVLTDPDETCDGPRLFSRNRGNVTALFDKDHGGERTNGRGVAWVRDVLMDHGFDGLAQGRILLLAQPRVWGHVFNPVSFWLIYDDSDVLRMVIAEVNNTYGDRHSYLCYHKDLSPIEASDRLKARKIFHVSPFQPVEGEYTFRFDITPEHIGIVIDYRSTESGVYATFHGPRKPMTNASIVGAALARPMGSLRVLALIHWQAVRLWWKGAGFRARPHAPETEVSS